MKGERKKLIQRGITGSDIADIASSGFSSLVANLPEIYDPIKFLVAAGAGFTAHRIVKMGVEIQEFLRSKKASAAAENDLPHRKLFETLRFFNNSATLDDDFIEALRNLHILTFAKSTKAAEAAEIYMLLETARKLNGPEILTVLAAYRIHHGMYETNKVKEILKVGGGNIETGTAISWLRMIAKANDYSSADYVERQQSHLEELHLIARREYKQLAIQGLGSMFRHTGHCRLTDSGYKLADFIMRGGKLFGEIQKS